MLTLALSIALTAAPAPARLEALSPTSGAGATSLIDGSASTGWSPKAGPAGEGVLLRFEAPLEADALELLACAETEAATVAVFVNGSAIVTRAFEKGVLKVPLTGGVRSLFFKIAQSPAPKVCLGEVKLSAKRVALALAAPTTVHGAVKVSSTLEPIDAYHAGYLFDGRTDFGWVEGAKGPGVGERVTLSLDDATELLGLELWNGYQRSPDHFEKNCRALEVTVQLDDGAPVTLAVKDAYGPQRLMLGGRRVAKVITLTVTEVAPGSVYQDLVLSELKLLGPAGSITVKTDDGAERQQLFEKELAGKPLAGVVNRELTDLCRPHTLTLRTDHTFASYESLGERAWESSQDVFDGAWIVRKQSKGWSTVEFFGRRHHSESLYRPYGRSEESSTVVIGGGQAQVAPAEALSKAELKKVLAELRGNPNGTLLPCVGGSDDEAVGQVLKARGIVVKGTAMVGVFH